MSSSGRRAAIGGLLLAAAACRTTYGLDPAGSELDAGAPTDDAAAPPPADSGGTTSGGPGSDAGDAGIDAPSGDPCPACPAGTTCLGAGCTVDGVEATCNAPSGVTTTGDFSIFACPTSPTIVLPGPCHGGGTFHAVPIHVPTGSWKLTLTGTNPFFATTACSSVTGCSGGSATVSDTFAGPATVLLGTTDTLTDCETLSLTVAH